MKEKNGQGHSMATLQIYNANKEKLRELNVSDDVFGIEPREGLLYEVVRWQQARKRAGNACTKTRAEVAGGGRKPWRQKGTGRARVGSSRNPVWRHGGVAHGPKPRDYSYTLPKKVRRLGLRMALSSKAMHDRLLVLDDYAISEIRTRSMQDLLDRFGIKSALLVADIDSREVRLSSRNLPGVSVVPEGGLNVYDILKYDYLVIRESEVSALEERLKP